MSTDAVNSASLTVQTWAEAGLNPDVFSALTKMFVHEPNFRSARASELVNESGGYHRPVRPEDFEWLALVPSHAENQTGLCALACQRVLACIYERGWSIHLPHTAQGDEWAAFRQFYGPRVTLLGESIRPFLESLLFDYWGQSSVASACSHQSDELSARFFELRSELERKLKKVIDCSGWGQKGLTAMLWLQHRVRVRGLVNAFRVALARGALLPSAANLVAELERMLSLGASDDELGLSSAVHAHWQFYLPTTLGVVNHAHRAALDGGDPLGLLGSLSAAVLLESAFLAVHGAEGYANKAQSEYLPRVAVLVLQATTDMENRFGSHALNEIARGMEQAVRVHEANDDDIFMQLEWLRRMPEGRRFAAEVDGRIRSGELSMPKETFVEPFEMCSTTHIHDDHRLVVIETGTMVFWAMPHMRLVLEPGESLFVPKGRLHGSTIETAESIYHQPVLSNELVLAGNSWLESALMWRSRGQRNDELDESDNLRRAGQSRDTAAVANRSVQSV